MLFYALLQNAEKRNESVVGSLHFCPNLCGLQLQGIFHSLPLRISTRAHCMSTPIQTHYVYIQAGWNPTVHTSTYTIVQSPMSQN